VRSILMSLSAVLASSVSEVFTKMMRRLMWAWYPTAV
jgi:hypothetical protein